MKDYTFPFISSFKGSNMNRKGELPFSQMKDCLNLIYIPTKYYQNISKGIKAAECIRFPHLKCMFMILNILLKSKNKYFIMYGLNFHRSFLHMLS